MWKYDKEKDYSKYENSYVTITYKVLQIFFMEIKV